MGSPIMLANHSFVWLGALWIGIVVALAAASEPAAATQASSQAEGRQAGAAERRLNIALYQDLTTVRGLQTTWPQDAEGHLDGTYFAGVPRRVAITLPDGRRVESWSNALSLIRHDQQISMVALFPLPEPLPLAEANDWLDGLLARWQVPDTRELKELKAMLRRAAAVGGRASAPLGKDCDVHVETRPMLDDSRRYGLVVTICPPVEIIDGKRPYPATAPAPQAGPGETVGNAPASGTGDPARQVEAFKQWEQQNGQGIDVDRLLNDPTYGPKQRPVPKGDTEREHK